jgi:Acyl transferase domain/Thiamine monophosphate synthase
MATLAMLFPGQGSQYVGMGKAIYEADPRAREIFAQAEALTGLPLRRLCFEGPMDELTQTVNLQPAITVVNLALYQALARAGVHPTFVAGHSLGEYSVLGPETIAGIVPRLGIPWTTMGGIKNSNLEQVVALGAKHPAVMTSVTAAQDVADAARNLRTKIKA